MNKFNFHIAALSLTSSFSAWSLGLGQITVHSYLNQPLLADIELIDVGSLPLSVIRAGLASSEEFERMGLELTNIATMLKFSVIRNSQGKAVIRVQTEERISEPFIEFLIDLASPEGQFYRAYSVLLDPPNYQLVLNQGRVAVKPRQQSASYDKQAGVIEKEVISHADYAPGDVGVTREAATYGPTLANENIWQIAQRYKTPDLLLQQIVLGIVGMNPDAFEMGNLNGLKAGKKLKIPSSKQLMTVPAEQSKLEVLAHDTAWEGKLPVSHVIEPPYMQPLGSQSVSTPIVSQDLELPSVLEKIPLIKNQKIDLEKMGQYMPNPKDFFSSAKSGTTQSVTTPSLDAKIGTEMSLAAAAIESVREANALLTQQFKLLQDDNQKLKRALGQKDLELKRLAKQIQTISTRQGVTSQGTAVAEGTSHPVLPWLFILLALSGAGGLAYRQVYWQKRMGTQWLGDEALEPQDDTHHASTPAQQTPSVRAQDVEIEIAQAPVHRPNAVREDAVPVDENPVKTQVQAEEAQVGTGYQQEALKDLGADPKEQEMESLRFDVEPVEDKPNEFANGSALEAESHLAEAEVSTEQAQKPLSLHEESDDEAPNDIAIEPVMDTLSEQVDKVSPSVQDSEAPVAHEPSFEFEPVGEASDDMELTPPPAAPLRLDEPVSHVIEFEPVLTHEVETSAPQASPAPSDDHALEFVLMSDDDEQPPPAVIAPPGEIPSESNEAEPLSFDEGDKPLRPKPVKSTQAIETLLALAKTYIVMGDMAAARESLQEVIRDGAGAHKEEAQKLLDELNGDKR